MLLSVASTTRRCACGSGRTATGYRKRPGVFSPMPPYPLATLRFHTCDGNYLGGWDSYASTRDRRETKL